MLNIKQVIERLKNNPEPIEVTNIRNKILSSFDKLIFIEEGHKYYLGDERLISCTTLIHRFQEEQDWDLIAENYALKYGLNKEDVQEDWHYNNIVATNSGTGTHLYGEMFYPFLMNKTEDICDIIKPQYEDGYLLPHSPKEEAVLKFNIDLFNIPNMYPVLVETRVYTGLNKKNKLKQNFAGTFDMLYYFKHPSDDTKSGLIILDYKTNKDLYKNFNENKLLSPFEEYLDCPFSHYILQLSAYQIPLEDIGLKVIGRRIIWLKEDGNYEKFNTPDVTKILRKVL